jgi:hypothetical protein
VVSQQTTIASSSQTTVSHALPCSPAYTSPSHISSIRMWSCRYVSESKDSMRRGCNDKEERCRESCDTMITYTTYTTSPWARPNVSTLASPKASMHVSPRGGIESDFDTGPPLARSLSPFTDRSSCTLLHPSGFRGPPGMQTEIQPNLGVGSELSHAISTTSLWRSLLLHEGFWRKPSDRSSYIHLASLLASARPEYRPECSPIRRQAISPCQSFKCYLSCQRSVSKKDQGPP